MELRARVFLYAWVAIFGVVACQEPTTFEATNTDKFTYDNEDDYEQAKKVLKADYVIAVDYGYRMDDHVEALIETFDSFLSDLGDEGIDYRVGFVRGATQYSGNTQETRDGTPTNFLGKSFLSRSSSSSTENKIMDTLFCPFGNYCVGEPNAPQEVLMLEAVARALDSQKSKFLRDSAQLVLAFFSNADDSSDDIFGSSRTTSYYKSKFRSYKDDNAYVSARAFVRGTTSGCAAGSSTYGYATGTRLKTVAEIDAGGEGNHCLDDADYMSSMLEDLARDVTRPTKRFKVQSKAVGTTVKVFIDGDEADSSDWSFNASTNEVIFDDGAEPDPEQSLLITFVPIIELSRDPDVESMSVTVDGSKVSRSNSNGWSVSDRRLLFHGSAVPDHNAKIVVNYQVN
jgi:hypothetical protein